MSDLTQITTPYGLLDGETQEQLLSSTGPFEMLTNNGWMRCVSPAWDFGVTYRVMPNPPEPREFFVVRSHSGHFHSVSEKYPDWVDRGPGGFEIIKVREVLA